jgi:cytochrome c2
MRQQITIFARRYLEDRLRLQGGSMTRRTLWFLTAALLVMSLLMTVSAGGPPIVTVGKLPQYFLAGRTETFTFTVRAIWGHHEPVDNGFYGVRAIADRKPQIKVPAAPTGRKGEYSATLALPDAGEWTITIDIAPIPETFSNPLLPVMAIQPGSPEPRLLSQVELGERFFVEKGCVSCHDNEEVSSPKVFAYWKRRPSNSLPYFVPDYPGGPPDLTGRKYPADYLTKFLSNPARFNKDTNMPNLGLSREDIAALVAFMNRERTPTVSRVTR